MLDYFSNLRFFIRRFDQFRPGEGSSYIRIHLLYLISSLAVSYLAVWLPAAIIGVVTSRQSILFVLFSALSLAIAQIIMHYCQQSVSIKGMQVRIAEIQVTPLHMMNFSAEKMESEYGEKLVRYSSNALYRGNDEGLEAYLKGGWEFMAASLSAAVLLWLSALLSPAWMLLLLVPSLIKELLKLRYYKLRRNLDPEFMDVWLRGNYFERMALMNQAAKDLRIFNLTKLFQIQEKDLLDQTTRLQAKLAYTSLLYDSIGLLLFLGRDLVSVYILVRALKNGLSISQFVLYLSLIPGLSLAFANCFKALVMVRGNAEVVNNLRLIYQEPFYTDGDFPEAMPCGQAEIVFENVSYAYPKKTSNNNIMEIMFSDQETDQSNPSQDLEAEKNYAIKNLNLQIRAGEKVSLVGNNGAGKTTLAKLAAGIISPDQGRILINGKDLQKINPKDRYKYTTLVFQDIHILAMSIADNIAGQDQARIDRDRVWQVLDQAGLGDFVRSLDKGIDTQLTTYLSPDGLVLSGGQMQKLVLAKSLYKGGEFLILDEPTAALDPLAEAKLYQEYLSLAQDKTTVFISHRLSSAQFCNRIILLDRGQILEEGSHPELMAQKGQYYEMFATQAKYYKEEVEGQ